MVTRDLSRQDLIVDQVYGGSRLGNAGDDPLPELLGVDSGAGFRHLGQRPEVGGIRLLVLKTSFNDANWPDSLDKENGLFTYFGDNRNAGELHDTPRKGNAILRNIFDYCHDGSRQGHFPPILLFGGTGTFRDVRFLGLAVPGGNTLTADEDLVAVWRISEDGVRFQNYKAIFTILNIPIIKRQWIDDVAKGKAVTSSFAPEPWLKWIKARKYTPLSATPVQAIRTKDEQLNVSKRDIGLLERIVARYSAKPVDFETLAIEIAKLGIPGIASYELTRPWRDGGRDAFGVFRIGRGSGGLDVEFALEAKCYALNHGVGVKDISRLISRLRYRQFGILVTTSYLGTQAYREIKDDGHPIVVITGGDITKILRNKIGPEPDILRWVERTKISER